VGESITGKRTLETRQDFFDVLGDLFELPLDHVTPDQKDLLWNRVHSTHLAWQESEAAQ
ncbi:MAG: hypothetical protein JWN99_1185, partial [Ilumatobacteraceae bacterium]|nr:hypothetical protein [Ilumatobacteraceae bacterium]